MSDSARILLVDDEPFNLDLLCQELEDQGYELVTARNGQEALEKATASPPDVILLDIMMPGMNGYEVCRRLKAADATRHLPVIFMTALSDTADIVKAFELGGADYVTKPFQEDELLARVRTHVELKRTADLLVDQNRRLTAEVEAHRRAQHTIEYLRDEIESELHFEEIVGKAPALMAALEMAEQVAGTNATVLIGGETGSGKELFARAIHKQSTRRDSPLIKLNCAALPTELVESELFGHEAGAFTGATRSRKGRFELADGGTLFLDEVGELGLGAQAKLLRVLQEREIERVGSSRTIHVDVRVIAASNRDLRQEVTEGNFRDDLFYRLSVFPIDVPPLRLRTGDISLLAHHFLAVTAREMGKTVLDISPAALRELESYAWPGNVRELQNVINRSVILCRGSTLQIPEKLGGDTTGPPARGTLEEVERSYIDQVLTDCDWVIEGEHGAASRLGLNPSTLRGRMRKLAIARSTQ